jgi:hypothetical protein
MYLAMTDDPVYIGMAIFFLVTAVTWFIVTVFGENIKDTVRELVSLIREMRR